MIAGLVTNNWNLLVAGSNVHSRQYLQMGQAMNLTICEFGTYLNTIAMPNCEILWLIMMMDGLIWQWQWKQIRVIDVTNEKKLSHKFKRTYS